jgi:hypothetical protein
VISFVTVIISSFIKIWDDVIESSNCKKKVKRKYTFQNECVNAADTVSDSAIDKSTDDRSHHGNLFDYSTITDVNTHMSDFDKTTDNDSDKTNHNIKLSDINLFQNCDFTSSNVKDLQALPWVNHDTFVKQV